MSWETADAADRIATIASFLSEWAADRNVPGVSVAITTSDGRVYSEAIGSRDLASNAPATPATIYGVGSITKSFTALAVLQLAEAGSLSLDDPVTEHLDVAFPADLDPDLSDLLTHRSGLPSLGTSAALIARLSGIGEMGIPLGDREDFYRHLAGAGEEIDLDGGRVMYSNESYVLLADVVEAVDGRSLPAYLQAELFEPIGMERSTFSHEAVANDANAITPYRLVDGDPVQTDLPIRELSAGPGGLLAPVTDIARYVRLQLGGGTIDGERIVSPELLESAWMPRVDTPIGGYGYGWRTRTVLGQPAIGHSGSIAVSTAYAGFLPDADLGVVVACNTSPGYSLRYVGEAIAVGALGEDPWATPFFSRRRRLDRLTGEYVAYRGFRRGIVERRGGILELTFDDAFGEQSTALLPAEDGSEPYRFEAVGPGGERWPVEFVESDGSIDLFIKRWRLHQV